MVGQPCLCRPSTSPKMEHPITTGAANMACEKYRHVWDLAHCNRCPTACRPPQQPLAYRHIKRQPGGTQGRKGPCTAASSNSECNIPGKHPFRGEEGSKGRQQRRSTLAMAQVQGSNTGQLLPRHLNGWSRGPQRHGSQHKDAQPIHGICPLTYRCAVRATIQSIWCGARQAQPPFVRRLVMDGRRIVTTPSR